MKTSKSPSDFKAPRRRSWVLFWGYTFLVLAGSLTPSAEIPDLADNVNGLFLHFVTYFLFFRIARAAFVASTGALAKHPVLFGFAYCQMIGVILEWLQLIIPGRAFQVEDIAVNMAGSLLAVGMARMKPFLKG